jgi:tyrosine-protein phosphatase
MTSPSPRKPRNAKGLALRLSPTGDSPQQTQAPLISSIASPAFVKPPPPKPRKKPSLLSLQTPANPAPNPLPRLSHEPPPTPSVTRPTTLKHYHSSPQILFSPGPGDGPAGGMQLPNFERSRISGLSTAFRKPSALVESTSMGPGSTIEEEDIPIRTQIATRSTADIGGDPFDAPPSQEEAQSPGYPDGPIAIYEPYVHLYLEPTAEEASKFDVVINVASEVKNPFKVAQVSKGLEEAAAPKTTFDSMDLDRDNIPVPDTAASVATFKTAFEWQPDQQTPTDSSPTTPKPLVKSEPEYIHVPWEHNTDISKELMGLCEIIDNRTKESKKVLVHCQQGASRSASLIIAYGLYKDPSLTVNDAYHAAQARSKWISPNMKLMYALQDFQKELEKKRLLSAAGHKRGGGRSPTKHRTTLSADAVEFSPKDPPLTAPLPDRDGNSPAGNTPLRLRGNSTPNIGEVSPGPSSAPSSFAWTPKAEKAPEVSEYKSAVTQTDFGFSQSTFGFSQSGFSETGPRSFNHGGFGSFPQPSYDTPPDSGFSSQTNQQQATNFNAFPSLSAAGNQQRDIGLTLQNIATFPTEFTGRAIDDTPPTPSLWSPRIQDFTANPLRQSFAPIQPLDNRPPSPALMSPRVTEFVHPFRPAPTTNFSRPLNVRPAVLRPVVDPRSPARKGETPIIRSIDEVL